MIIYEDGVVSDFNLDLLCEIESMPSFVSMELFAQKGGVVRRTVDCFTFGGVIRLVHSDQATILRDYERIREIEKTGFIYFAK